MRPPIGTFWPPLGSIFSGVAARLALFGALAAVTVVLAMPNPAVEAALQHVGQRLCVASITGAPVDLDTDWRNDTWSPPTLDRHSSREIDRGLAELRPYFALRCEVAFWRGARRAGGTADYLLFLYDGTGAALTLGVETDFGVRRVKATVTGVGRRGPIVRRRGHQ